MCEEGWYFVQIVASSRNILSATSTFTLTSISRPLPRIVTSYPPYFSGFPDDRMTQEQAVLAPPGYMMLTR